MRQRGTHRHSREGRNPGLPPFAALDALRWIPAFAGMTTTRHVQPPVTVIDRELFRFQEIWAAAGHPHGVFRLRPQDLERLTGAPVADVTQEPAS